MVGSTPREVRWFCLLMSPIGLLMAGFAAYSAITWTVARSWPAVPCFVEASSVEVDDRSEYHIFRVRYRYPWQRREYESAAVRQEYEGSWDIADADRLLREFPAGTWRTCQANPNDPTRAVLEHSALTAPLVLLFGGIVVAAYLGLVFFGGHRLLESLSGPLVACFGIAIYVYFFGLPLTRGITSRGWEPRPCIVLSSQVRSGHPHGNRRKIRAFWPDVVFRYEVVGVAYRANTWNASFVGSPWYYGPRGVVGRYPPELVTTCYVNTDDPTQAVLDRSLSSTQWFGLYPLFMVALGLSPACLKLVGGKVQLGTPRLWGTVILGAITTIALTGFYVTGLDLIRDRREGVAERPEIGIVVLLGFFSAALLLFWIGLAYSHAVGDRSPARLMKTSKWDEFNPKE
jgi:hypothetical protein